MTPPSTVAVMDALMTRLIGIQWTPEGGSAEAAFQTVTFHDVTELADALVKLVSLKARIALVIYDGRRHDTSVEGMTLRSKSTIRFTILLADRNMGSRAVAWRGNAGQPGVIRLEDLIAQNIPGVVEVAGQPVMFNVTTSQGTVLTANERDEAVGRATVWVDVEASMPDVAFNLEERPV